MERVPKAAGSQRNKEVEEAKPRSEGHADLALFGAEERDAGREDHENEGRSEQKVMHSGSP